MNSQLTSKNINVPEIWKREYFLKMALTEGVMTHCLDWLFELKLLKSLVSVL